MKVTYVELDPEYQQRYHPLNWPTEFFKPPCIGETVIDSNLNIHQLIVDITHDEEGATIYLNSYMADINFLLARKKKHDEDAAKSTNDFFPIT